MLQAVEEQLKKLKEFYPSAKVTERMDGSIFIEVPDLPMPSGWDKQRITIYLNLPPGYPTAKPNGFETDADVCLADGRRPSSGCGQHAIDGRTYLHFCWQPGAPWANDPHELWKRVKFALMRFSDVPG